MTRLTEPCQVLVTESAGYSVLALQEYRRAGEVVLGDRPEAESTLRPQEVGVVVVRLGQFIDAAFLDRFPNLRFVVSPTTGLNHIDLDACGTRGIEIISLKGETAFLDSITGTSELALGLMLALLRRIPAAHQHSTVDLGWDRDLFCARMLSRMTVGIIGLGRLGRQMAKMCHGLGMNVLACDPHLGNADFVIAEAKRVSLLELAAQSDVVSLHADYRKENDGMIDGRFLAACRPGTLLVNTARGELCDETALAGALDTGHLGGLATDVLRDEQSGAVLAEHPLVQRARRGMNVIITPHIGGCCADAMRETEEFAARKLLSQIDLSARESYPA
ncbi:MAG: NAD(P)-dependent oxidoreductase [Prosthecobacter sp.]